MACDCWKIAAISGSRLMPNFCSARILAARSFWTSATQSENSGSSVKMTLFSQERGSFRISRSSSGRARRILSLKGRVLTHLRASSMARPSNYGTLRTCTSVHLIRLLDPSARPRKNQIVQVSLCGR